MVQSTADRSESFTCTTLCPGYFCPSSCPQRGDPEPGVGERRTIEAQDADGPGVLETSRGKSRAEEPADAKQ